MSIKARKTIEKELIKDKLNDDFNFLKDKINKNEILTMEEMIKIYSSMLDVMQEVNKTEKDTFSYKTYFELGDKK